MCGNKKPIIEDRWCSFQCKREGQKMIAEDPTPVEIAQAATRIRTAWSASEMERRRAGFKLASLLDLPT